MEPELPAPSRECGFPIGEKRGGWGADRAGAGALASRGGRAGGAGKSAAVERGWFEDEQEGPERI